ncbi:hypothetical protein [Tautonia sociabilis]|uniref:hypothetical protein n=1 Tax=Tautonia sociabilis TaxID=2080755 RepID=UPI0013153348|nr:hypothetical protein [Tautonia sociabilis]
MLQAAVSVLNQAREAMLDQMAETVLSMADEFAEGGFQVNEFLELNGSRLHFLCLLISQLEQLGELRALSSPPTPARERKREKRSRRWDQSPVRPPGEEPSSTCNEEVGNEPG